MITGNSFVQAEHPVSRFGAGVNFGLGALSLGGAVVRGGEALALGGESVSSGSVNYGALDSLGRPTGVSATITEDMLGTGTSPLQGITPPGWLGGGAGQARGHLLAAQLGGRGDLAENLVTLQQNPFNSPRMRGYETAIANAVRAGETVNYSVTPIYKELTLIPRAITLSARGSGGFSFDVTLLHSLGK